MLVILSDEQILSTRMVCTGCLLATHQGTPRWHQGHLGCGHSLNKTSPSQPSLYECEMGFKLAEIEEPSLTPSN